jgi:hypothetical protein
LKEQLIEGCSKTRPIRGQVLARLYTPEAAMREGFEQAHSDTETGLRRLERKIDILNKNILDVRTDQQESEERVNKLDSQPTQ